MLDRMMIGATALTIGLVANGNCIAAGAVAVGQPSDIAKDGVAIFTDVNNDSVEIAKKNALAGCKGLKNASPTSKSLCKIIATFEDQCVAESEDQCVAESLDPESGTPGFGWAMARTSKAAKEQALSNCRDTAGPTRQDACIIIARGVWCDGSAK